MFCAFVFFFFFLCFFLLRENKSHLDFVATRLAATTSALEFAASGEHVRFGGRVWHTRRAAKVFVRFAVRFAAAQQHAVGAGWALDRELIERQAATAGAFDARACSVGKAQRSNCMYMQHTQG